MVIELRGATVPQGHRSVRRTALNHHQTSIDYLIPRYTQELTDAGSYDVPSVTIGGAVGSGKSTILLGRYFLPALLGGMTYQFCALPRREAYTAAALAIFEGHRETLLIDDADDPSRGIGLPFVGISDKTGDPAEEENAELATYFVESVKTMFGDETETLISVEEWGFFAAQLIQYQKEPVDQRDIFHAVKPYSPVFRKLVDNCTNEAIKDKARQLKTTFDRSYGEYIKGVGATIRRLDVLERDPATKNRSWDGTPLVRELMRQNGIVIKICNDSRACAFAVRQWHKWHVRELERLWAELDEPTRCQMISDETFRRRYWGAVEIGSISRQRKLGINWVGCGPFPSLGDEVLDDEMTQGTNEHIWGRCASYRVAEMAVQDLIRIDAYKVKRQRQKVRIVPDGVEEIRTVSHGVTKDKHGHERHSENQGITFRQKHREVIDYEDEYQPVNEQMSVSIVDQMRLRRGVFNMKSYDEVSGPHLQPMFEDPWDGSGDDEVKEHLEWLRSTGRLKGAEKSRSASGVSYVASSQIPAHRRSKPK
jgi:hypothetical protein